MSTPSVTTETRTQTRNWVHTTYTLDPALLTVADGQPDDRPDLAPLAINTTPGLVADLIADAHIVGDVTVRAAALAAPWHGHPTGTPVIVTTDATHPDRVVVRYSIDWRS
jgi:hypothetical protein